MLSDVGVENQQSTLTSHKLDMQTGRVDQLQSAVAAVKEQRLARQGQRGTRSTQCCATQTSGKADNALQVAAPPSSTSGPTAGLAHELRAAWANAEAASARANQLQVRRIEFTLLAVAFYLISPSCCALRCCCCCYLTQRCCARHNASPYHRAPPGSAPHQMSARLPATRADHTSGTTKTTLS